MRKCILTFIFALALFTAALFLCAQIPASALKENYEMSAEILCEKPVFFEIFDGAEDSRIDRYADSILLNISYHYDGSMKSVMESAYYYQETQNENENLRDAVKGDLPANRQYLRYWHGSSVLVRLFHLIGNIRLMYVVNAILLVGGIVLLLLLLFRKHLVSVAVSLIFALVMGSIWFTPFCLEYSWTILIAIYTAVFVLWKAGDHYPVFLLSGMLAAYLDFLTTETLTLLLPLLLLIAIEERKGMVRKNILRGCAWIAGYILTWLAKWVIAAIVLGGNVLPSIMENAQERIGGSIGVSLPEYLIGAIVRNVRCLFPFQYGIACIFGGIALAVFVAYWIFVYRNRGADRTYILVLLLLAAVPLLRFLVLRNHSYLHYFFTFRALTASVLGIGLAVRELTSSKRKT